VNTDVNAFALLEQLAALAKIRDSMQADARNWVTNARILRAKADEIPLRRLRDALAGVARALEDNAEVVNRLLEVYQDEQKTFRERLQGVVVKEADLDEIRRKRKDAADGVKDRRAGAGTFTAQVAWGTVGGTTT
jgi:hypothetical protein